MRSSRSEIRSSASGEWDLWARIPLHFPDIDQLKHVPATIVLTRWRAYAHFAIDNPGLYRLMSGSELPPAKAFDMPDSPGRRAFTDGVQSIAQAQQAGRVTATDDPFRLTSLVWAAVHGLVSLRMDRPNFPWTDLDPMIEQTVRRLLIS
jgi:hypothetical protein